MTFPTISDPAVAKVLLLLAINAAWLIICLFIKMIDMVVSMLTLKKCQVSESAIYISMAEL